MTQPDARRSAAFLAAPDPIIVEDAAGEVVDLNAAAERVYGWPRDELVGRPAETLVPPEQRRSEQHWTDACRRGDAVRDEPGQRCSRSGAVHPVLVSKARLDGGAVATTTRHVAPARDASAALRRSEERYRSLVAAILETAVEGIITIDERGTVESINTAARRMFGYEADEVIGENVKMLMPAPYRDEHDGYLRNYMQGGDAKIIGIGREATARRKDGTVFPIVLSVSEVLYDGRRLFAGFVRDITDLKDVQGQLMRSERLAGIGEMITGLAHESRNALQRMQACLEMLELEVHDQPRAVDYLQRLQNAQDYLSQLYEEVRSYAAPLRLDRRRCDLRRLWGAAWADLEVSWKDRSLELVDASDGADVECEVDPFAAGQVFRNIFENAITACGDEGRIDVSCAETVVGERPALALTVSDTGPGLTAEEKEKIFQPFFTTKTKGTGLGMAIVRRIVEAHGGRIEIGGGARDGAAIVVTLPREAE